MRKFSEQEIEEIVYNKLPSIFPELKPKERGYHIDQKTIVDIYAKDKDGADCLVELKEGKLTPNKMRSLMGQLLDYSNAFYKKKGNNPKLYALVEEFSKDQIEYLNRHGIICGEYCNLPIFQKMRAERDEEEKELDEIERKASEITVG